MIVENQILDEINLHIQAKREYDDIQGWFAILTDSIHDLKIVSEALKPYGALSDCKKRRKSDIGCEIIRKLEEQ